MSAGARTLDAAWGIDSHRRPRWAGRSPPRAAAPKRPRGRSMMRWSVRCWRSRSWRLLSGCMAACCLLRGTLVPPGGDAMPTSPAQCSPTNVYLSELSPGSHRTMRIALRTAVEFFGGSDPDTFRWERLRVEHLAALRADLAGRLAPNTANKVLAGVRGVLKASWRVGRLSAEHMYRCTDVRRGEGGAEKRGGAPPQTELRGLFFARGGGAG